MHTHAHTYTHARACVARPTGNSVCVPLSWSHCQDLLVLLEGSRVVVWSPPGVPHGVRKPLSILYKELGVPGLSSVVSVTPAKGLQEVRVPYTAVHVTVWSPLRGIKWAERAGALPLASA